MSLDPARVLPRLAVLVLVVLCGAIAFFLVRAPGTRPPAPASPEILRVDGNPVTVALVVSLVEGKRSLGDLRQPILAETDPTVALALLGKATDEATVTRALEQAIDVTLAEAAARTQPPATEEEIDARLASRRKRLERPNGPSLEQLLAARGGIPSLRHELAVEAALDRLAGAPSDDEVARAFAERKDAWTGRRLRLSQILVESEQEARDVKAALDRGGSWDEVCRARSKDKGSRERAGDLGWVKREGDVPEDLARTAFALDKGAVGDPVRTRYGWHVVRWMDEQRGANVTLDEVRGEVVGDVARRKRQDYVRALREKARIDQRVR